MKKCRLLIFLCALMLLVGSVSFASAVGQPSGIIRTDTRSNVMSWNNVRLIENGEAPTFYLISTWSMYEKEKGVYLQYDDMAFDCKGKVKAKTSTSWIHITDTKTAFILALDANETLKTRTGKVTVTGSGFKSVITFKQFGADKLLSVTRNKNKVTVKVKYGSAPSHNLWIYGSLQVSEDESRQKNVADFYEKKTSYTFKVSKGWHYSVYVGPGVPTEWGGYNSTSSSYAFFTVEKTTGTEKYDINK